MSKKVLKPPTVKAKGSYSPGWEVSNGRMIHIAGQIPWDANGQTVAKGDVAGQTRQVFANIGAVLAEAGGTLEDVIKITIFAADIRFRDVINQVRTEVFSPPYPASTQLWLIRIGLWKLRQLLSYPITTDVRI